MVSSIRILSIFSFAMMVACSFSGCSRGPQKFDISGSVSIDGKPVEHATIMFAPVAGAANETAAGKVEQGQYTLQCLGGEKFVRFVGQGAGGKLLPMHYISGSELKTTVTEDATGVDFALTNSTRGRRRR